VGFRPFVYRIARALGVAGWVCNDADGVRIRAEGFPEDLVRFRAALAGEAPPSAVIDAITTEPAEPEGCVAFAIRASGPPSRPRVRVPRDLATCPACLREVFDPADRRHGYPFTNCTECGPRYSILTGLPYDRPATSMRTFTLCPACRAEYERPEDRRFHAQPIACPACGPRVTLRDPDGVVLARAKDAVVASRAMLEAGQILALKGLGGFQLLVRADRSDGVARLRARKHRPTKPLAVMVPTLEAAAGLGVVGEIERRLLAGADNPIVLLDRAGQGEDILAPEVAPRLAAVGVFLPTTPLHHLLLAGLDFPAVVTSGNRGDEPIVTDDRDAVERLGPIADALLLHDRPIVRRVDDSVVRVIAGRAVTLRLARGSAPLPLPAIERLARTAVPLLATGGHQKVAPALWSGTQAVLAQHLGDMDGAEARAAFAPAVRDLAALYGVEPEAIACDLHPEYFTSRWAEARGTPVVAVQHHHAHAVAAMVEHDLLDREVLALTWDGTGFGADGTVWGGEALRARVDGFKRVASLLPFPLPGNAAAIRQPRRTALGVLALALGDDAVLGDPDLLDRLGLSARAAATLLTMARRGVNTAWTSSVGRLFDAVAALLLGAGEVSHEGEAASWLESVAAVDVIDAYPLPILPADSILLGAGDPAIPRGDWRPMLAAMRDDLDRGEPVGVLAARFHNALARWAAAVVAGQPSRDVVLGGGCFQNRLLTERTIRAIEPTTGVRVYGPGRIPPGDGGLAVGQLVIGLARIGAIRPGS
jgi:hydrogenase maturation protein HypF